MGGDGGFICNSRKYWRNAGTNSDNAAKGEEQSERYLRKFKIQRCSLSDEILSEPILCDDLGNLYNKESLISNLLAFMEGKESRLRENQFSHIRKLKDCTECKFTKDEGKKIKRDVSTGEETLVGDSNTNNMKSNVKDLTDASVQSNEDISFSFICPITNVEMNGVNPFVLIRSSGHVISKKAIDELGMDELQEDYGSFSEQDLIQIGCVPEFDSAIISKLREQMMQRKTKKKKKNHEKQKEKTDQEKERHILVFDTDNDEYKQASCDKNNQDSDDKKQTFVENKKRGFSELNSTDLSSIGPQIITDTEMHGKPEKKSRFSIESEEKIGSIGIEKKGEK